MAWFPGVDTTVILVYGFSAAALVAGRLLIPLWNRVPPTGRAQSNEGVSIGAEAPGLDPTLA